MSSGETMPIIPVWVSFPFFRITPSEGGAYALFILGSPLMTCRVKNSRLESQRNFSNSAQVQNQITRDIHKGRSSRTGPSVF